MLRHVTVDARLAQQSGIGTYIQEVVPRVIALLPDTAFTLLGDPTVLTTLAGPSARVTHRTLRAPLYSAAEQLALARAIPRATSIVWMTHYPIPLLRRRPLAVMVHDVNHLVLPQSSWVRRAYARGMFRAVGRRAAVVLCNSHFTASEIAREVAPRAPIVVARLGVSARWLASAPAATRPEGPYLLYVGNVKPHKNLQRLLAAFRQVAPAIPHRLVVVGERDGFLSGDPGALGMAEGLGDRVHVTGRVSRDEVERWVRGCDALVLPSLYEGFGLPALEALAAGRPVGAARAGALPEVCGPEAEYFDPTDASDIAAALHRLAALADSEERRERRRAWARQFDWDRCASLTADALRRAAEGSASR